jgi:hypothetical protein
VFLIYFLLNNKIPQSSTKRHPKTICKTIAQYHEYFESIPPNHDFLHCLHTAPNKTKIEGQLPWCYLSHRSSQHRWLFMSSRLTMEQLILWVHTVSTNLVTISYTAVFIAHPNSATRLSCSCTISSTHTHDLIVSILYLQSLYPWCSLAFCGLFIVSSTLVAYRGGC